MPSLSEIELRKSNKPRKLKLRYPIFVSFFCLGCLIILILWRLFFHIKTSIMEYFLLIILPGVFLLYFRRIRKQREILIGGDILDGIVVVDKFSLGGGRHLTVNYEYEGRYFESTIRYSERNDGFFSGGYSPGEIVTILITPDSPEKFVVYSAADYRVIA